MNTTQIDQPAANSGIFKIGGDLPVVRLGFGAMRITGRGIWGEPADRKECIAVLRRAVELGITLIDTADSYGPFVSAPRPASSGPAPINGNRMAAPSTCARGAKAVSSG